MRRSGRWRRAAEPSASWWLMVGSWWRGHHRFTNHQPPTTNHQPPTVNRNPDPEDPSMATNTFHLPDLGEGLPDATIVEWHVKVGDTIRLDDNLVSMETAKAVVDVPSPVSGKVLKLGGAAGDVIDTGAMLAEFEVDASQPQRAEGQDTGHHHGARPAGRGVGAPDPAPDDRVVASTEGGAIERG